MDKNNNIYEQNFEILSYYVDFNSRLTPSYLLLLMQDTAWKHVEKHGIGWDYLAKSNQFWALTRLHVVINQMPKWKDKIVLKTWGKEREKILHFRDYELFDIEGTLLAYATSTWVVLDFTTGKPQNLEDYPTYLYVNKDRNAIEQHVPKIENVNFSQQQHVYKKVLYSDLDVNKHVNNSKYIQFAIDALPVEYVKKHDISEFFITFNYQAKDGDLYMVNYKETDSDIFVFSIILDSGIELARLKILFK